MLETHKICNNYDILSFPQNAKSQNQLQSTKTRFHSGRANPFPTN